LENHEILEKEALRLIEKLLNNDIRASIDEDSFKDYSVKISLEEKGKINLFYSPNKNDFKINTKNIKESKDEELVNDIWNTLIIGSDKNSIYKNKGYEIDVDGSYFNGKTAWASIIRKDGKVIKELSGLVNTENIKNSHQIAGEIKAVIESIKFCRTFGINEIRLYYDYSGLKFWAKGLWKTKLFVSKYYQDFMQEVKIKIDWVKIESHKGYFWNEKVDELAKKAINPNG